MFVNSGVITVLCFFVRNLFSGNLIYKNKKKAMNEA